MRSSLLMLGVAMWQSILVISLGAAAGALTRWGLGLGLNALFPLIPLGTLTANLLGGYLVGLAVAALAQFPMLAPEWRLLIVTGFLGGLTTFSTFSAEMVALLREGRFFWAGAGIAAHVLGSLGMTILGMATYYFIRRINT